MALQDVQFPAATTANPWKLWVVILAGRALARMAPQLATRVAAGKLRKRIGLLERLLIAALVDKHERADTLDLLAPLHSWLWSGEQAVVFHEYAKGRFDTWWLAHHSAIVEPIRQLIDAPGSPYSCLCEIGCGSGLILEDLAMRLPRLARFIGLDLCAAQVVHNRRRELDARIRFETGDAISWVPEHGHAQTIYLTVAGVFEYFPRSALQLLFATVARRQHPAVIAVVEPIPANYDIEREIASRPYGFEKSLGHNYVHLLREAGFAIRYQQRQMVDGQSFLLVVAES